MKRTVIWILCLISISCSGPIDRRGLVSRHDPHVTEIDALSSLSVGNGGFCFTADVTGMQSFPEIYSTGVPLGTMSHWGWHSFPNDNNYSIEDCLVEEDFGRGHPELYAVQSGAEHLRAAADYVRSNPHRMHLGCIGFADLDASGISDINQRLDLWNGVLYSDFKYEGSDFHVLTSASVNTDAVCFEVESAALRPVQILFPYPTGAHTDDACRWDAEGLQSTEILTQNDTVTIVRRLLDETVYYLAIRTEGAQKPKQDGADRLLILPEKEHWAMSVLFSQDIPSGTGIPTVSDSRNSTAEWWNRYWSEGAAVDFSRAEDPRAEELERRVVLSQYLTAIQCAAPTPPAETGLTYNSWFGKFHMEMIWWHEAHFALWGHPEMLERTLPWYLEAAPQALRLAQRQGFDGVRWMKMTDPSGKDTPSDIGSYLIWQQPHLIYLAELLRRAGRDVSQYAQLVEETADFMASFLVFEDGRYVIKGCIPAQETLKPETTVNPPFELSYWYYGLKTAQEWRVRSGMPRSEKWDDILDNLSPLAESDGLYLAAESEPDTYNNVDLTSDHMAVLAAYGMLPASPLFIAATMRNTLDWVMDNWHWERTWGWDFPVVAMNATRLGCPELAVDALLMETGTNTFLVSGHNWQNESLRCYLPGNGGLLSTVAMMCAGYDGCTEDTPGFPKSWHVRWEGLSPLF